MDGVIDTVSAAHPTAPLIDLLKAHGKLVVVGASAEPMSVPSIPLLMGKNLLLTAFSKQLGQVQAHSIVLILQEGDLLRAAASEA